jgi:hypothetical protein
MSHIILTEEQARLVSGSSQPIEVRDPGGRVVAQLTPLTAEDMQAIEASKRVLAAKEESYPSERVERLLQRFDEMDAKGELDQKSAEAALQRLFAGEEP